MFGLMRFQGACDSHEEQRRWRMHYCGTCKTIGSRYGQRARLLLNHDAAFLAELLHSLTGVDAEQWPQAYLSWNCLRLPEAQEIPHLLRYTAAANVLLGECKVRDHEEDSGSRGWAWVRRFFSPAFRKAQADLKAFGFPLEETAALLARQAKLEAMVGVHPNRVAEPTAQVTALVFRHGAQLAGLHSRLDSISAVGHRFGRLIYLIDAWQDYDRDARTGAFNALYKRGFGREWAAGQIRAEGVRITAAFEDIGVPLEFRLRLRANIEAALGSPLRVLPSCTTRSRQTIRMRWREAVNQARGWQAPLLTFVLVVAMAFVFQRHARLAKSARECLSLGMNLMALGGMIAMVAGPGHRKGRLRACCNTCWCDPDCDCCCDGCCDTCGDSCCSSCDCCSGCDCS